MSVFSVFSVFTLLIFHLIVINNQVNIVSSTENDEPRMFQLVPVRLLEDEGHIQEFVNKVITSIKERLDKKGDDYVVSCQSIGVCLKSHIKDQITQSLITDVEKTFEFLDQNHMDQIANATNR